jgi:ATP-dependent helicase HrpB
MKSLIQLPIDTIKEKILFSFNNYTNIILKASPGSGKTTRIPRYLLEETEKSIYILEPRRLAAKLAAYQVARELGEQIGSTVGYQFRFEKMTGPKTRIYFLTEGTFLKILSHNKNLDDVGIIILDEFHERHLSTDASLSFITKLQKEKRPDLKIVIMSATIDTTPLENFLKQFAPTYTIELESNRFPLTQEYLPNITSLVNAPLAKKVRNCFEEIIEKELPGNILVFLPGMKEIKECESLISNLCAHYCVNCLTLHGDMDSREQDAVLMPGNIRKIILATNIAESSVTIPGIRIVIDSGLQRESSYDFYSGLPLLKITKISKASATQRSGRANREGPGFSFRLYAQLDYDLRPDFSRPEIERSDISDLYLQAIDLFDSSLEKLDWLDPPPAKALTNAYELLRSLNAINLDLKMTEAGHSILSYPLHPRWGKIMSEAQKNSREQFIETLTFLAEAIGEKNSDRLYKQLNKQLSYKSNTSTQNKCLEEILLTGFADRIARARGNSAYEVITCNGETIKIAPNSAAQFDPTHELWIVMELSNKGEATHYVAIEEEWLYSLEPFPITEEIKYLWDEKKECIYQIAQTKIGAIILSEERSLPLHSNNEIRKILFQKMRDCIEMFHSQVEFERLLTMNKILNSINMHLIESFEEKIVNEFTSDGTHFNQNDKEEFAVLYFSSLKDFLDPENIFQLEADFPLFLQLTDKRKIPITYERASDPWIESFIQDFYGLLKTPLVAKGKIPLTLKLLGPHKRALQVTQDLESFWQKTYPEMLKELMREYPRHYWPLTPEKAKPILLKRQVPV